MGRMIEQIAKERGHEIVSVIDIDNQDDFASEAFRSADVAIEFTAPHVAYANYQKAWDAGVKVVSGSTGWLDEHGDDVRKACTEGGKTLFWASNFSLGVAIFSAVNKYLARIMNQFPVYDVRMEETHHIHKLDAPSGTAKMFLNSVIDISVTDSVNSKVPTVPETDNVPPDTGSEVKTYPLTQLNSTLKNAFSN